MSTPSSQIHGTDGQGQDLLERRIADGPRGAARTWFDVLEVAPDVSAADLQKAYERALALVDGRSIGGYLMLDPMAAESARADVEAAYAVLADPERRRAYQDRLAATGELRPGTGVPVEAVRGGADDRVASPPSASAETPEAPELVRVAGWSLEGEPVAPEGADQDAAEARAILGVPAGDGQVEDRRASHLKFLAPAAAAQETPPRAETPRPGSLDIHFEPPSTDTGPAPAAPATHPTPASEAAPMQATGTVSPTAAMPPPTLAPEVPRPSELPEEITGALIRELREARGLTLDEVALQTKVRRGVLQAIEEADIPNLPARVYLRGFLTQVGRVLKVDRNRLAEGYLRTIEKMQRG